ncbi:tRNA-uridine aminocarboxypropyltransferase [Marinobacterium jannaschii]|uniref:tRNA-uridine aminocarboxypropyltransferase n=1 Tax=Marinobacterium jannaschii TaxID=64970 RepID=UPI000488B2CE|nr:DTW domain-containing protein [Marinobacterium jannaschii]
MNYENQKPFVARGSNIERCEACLLPQRGCICDYRVSVEARARFWLLTHRYETLKPTNTGRLITDTIEGSDLFRWSRTEPDTRFLQALDDPAIDPYIVFPEGEDYQHRMVEFEHKPGRQPVFIILDGTWRQARRMFRHGRYLDRLPVIQPSTTRTSRYMLRKAQHDHHLCTAEVAVAMLEQIGDQASADVLEAYFDIFNQHYRASRLSRPIESDTGAKNLLRVTQGNKASVSA